MPRGLDDKKMAGMRMGQHDFRFVDAKSFWLVMYTPPCNRICKIQGVSAFHLHNPLLNLLGDPRHYRGTGKEMWDKGFTRPTLMVQSGQSSSSVPYINACANNMKQIGIGLHKFHDSQRHFPPVFL
jgi:hypothetical protein